MLGVIAALGTAGCDSEEAVPSQFDESQSTHYESEYEETEWENEVGETQIEEDTWDSEEGIPPEPDDPECMNYEFEYDEGVWECDDNTSSSYGYYYYAGRKFASLAALRNDSSYQQYKQSSNFKTGFGSGTKVSGS